jgi:two-component system OmpR family sensor kinase
VSLRTRIQLIVIAAVVAAFVVAGTVIALVARNQLVERIDDRAIETASALSDAGEILGRDELIDSLNGLSEVAERTDANIILDSSGRTLWALPSRTNGSDDSLPDLSEFDVEDLRSESGAPFTVDAVRGGERYRTVSAPLDDGVLVIATPLNDVRDTVGNLVLTMLAAAGAVVVVVGAVTTVASRRAVRPVDEMVAVAEAIGEGDLSQRIPVSDIGETARLGDALNNMLHQLEQSFVAQEASEERLRRFIANASHELRTPLTSIRGYAELYLTDVATDDESVDKAMRRIRSEAVRTGDLVNNLLLLARLDDHPTSRTELVDLTAVVAESVADLRATQPGRTVDEDLEDDVVVCGDGAQLRQVVANLCANTRQHAGEARVSVKLSSVGADAILTVSDEGPGMTPPQAARAFDRFWQASESRGSKDGGAGLGLSIVRTVVEAHGGTVTLDTTAGEGTTFTVRLPTGRKPGVPPDTTAGSS